MGKESAPRHIIFNIPPGAALLAGPGEPVQARVPMWLYWMQVAQDHAELARRARQPDVVIDDIARALREGGARQVDSSQWDDVGHEHRFGTVAVTASALALDAFYGAVAAALPPTAGPEPDKRDGSRPNRRTKRSRIIVETMKRGFAVGKPAQGWTAEVDRLFSLRDRLVHHAEVYEPVVTIRQTDATTVAAPELLRLVDAPNAEWAVALAGGIIWTCLHAPKRPLRSWAETRRDLTDLDAILAVPLSSHRRPTDDVETRVSECT